MEIKNLFDAGVKQDLINRINKLTPQTRRQWGQMDVAQMLALMICVAGIIITGLASGAYQYIYSLVK